MHAEYLGSRHARTLIVVVGRNNQDKASEPIISIQHRLHDLGASICWLDTKARFHGRQREMTLARIRHQWLSDWSHAHPKAGRLALRLIRLALKIKYPKRHAYVLRRYQAEPTAEGLRRFINTLRNPTIHVVTHSAGGILATQIANETAIQKIVCFGYPFKHPDHPEEPHRTSHLRDIRKPVLICQGRMDEYGAPEQLHRYATSSSIKVHAVESDHDYAALSAVEQASLTGLITDFLSLSDA
ncbi:MAG: alpha/beta family hydrolase [Aquabacterium sp.]|uniref:alpha/beta family hydrolase n=1 Tax=Aquabacterium sp. TaxID=1872578 RepID=UPI003BD8D735